MKTRLALSIALFTLTACGAPGQSAKTVAEHSVGSVGCKTSQSEMWRSLHLVAEQEGRYPEADELRKALIEAGETRGLKGEAFEAYVDAFLANYGATIEGIREKFAPEDLNGWKKALSEMEVGVRVTDVHAELQTKISSTLARLESAERALEAVCDDQPARDPAGELDPEPTKSFGTVWEQLLDHGQPEVYGARKTLATLYQSCTVLELPPMTASTPSVSGIEILPDKHPAGGLKRAYKSIANINSSHYYIKNQKLADNGCFEVRNSPPIYDFGGKPYTTASKPNELDMFRNGGSGTSVLGIDCSAYVFSALALAGLKLDPDPKKVMKADLVHGIPSTAFKNPQANGMRCMDQIKVKDARALENGDIVAISGHVVMIDDVGADPFGLAKIKKVEDCTSSKIPYQDFDFVINQSSPSKGGIGVNRFQARNYLAESSTYRDGLTRYAVAACKAKFGQSPTVDTSKLAVVRHKKTSDCKTEPLVATRQECVESCRAL